jgi:UDP-N-acetylmuramoyl-tripeptide--D-alanyl-D-alanine ligase
LPHVYGTSVAYAYAAATAVSEALDVPFEQVNDFSAHFSPAKGRARIIPGIKHTTLFDDTYNASPASVLQSLRDLASVLVEPNQRKIVCLGEMRELGDRAEEMHRRIGSEAAKLGIDILISCGIFGRAMADGALANGMKPEQVHVIEDTPEAGLFIQEMIQPGDIILAKGSEGGKPSSPNWGKVAGVRMERVIKELMAEPQRAQELLVRQSETWKRK